VNLEGLRVVFKAERDHRVQDVLAADRLALLELALLRSLGRDEADKLRHALLHALLGVLRDFGSGWHSVLHDARHVRNLRHHNRDHHDHKVEISGGERGATGHTFSMKGKGVGERTHR